MAPPPFGANSAAARDIASVLHPYTDLQAHQEIGPVVITRGKGVRVWDDAGKEYIESVAGLWCASLGFDNERLVQAAVDADAQAALLPRLHRQVARAHDRPGRDADRSRPGADEQGVLRQFRLRSERYRHQDGLVPQQRAGPAEQEEDHRPDQGLSRHHPGRGVADRARGQPPRVRRAAARLPAHDRAALLPRRQARRDRGRVRHPLRRGTGAADHRGRPRHGRRDVGRAGDGRRRRDRAAARLFRQDPGGAEEVRRPAGRRRGDLRLLAHRQLLGQPDARHRSRTS